MRGSSRFVPSFLVVVGALTLWNTRGGDLAVIRLAPADGPVACGTPTTSSWRSSAPCFDGVIRITEDACKTTVLMPNGDQHEEPFPTERDYLLFATRDNGWCHLDLEKQLLECDYRCDEAAEHCEHACRGRVTREVSARPLSDCAALPDNRSG
jgi:hypothetical protein